MSDKTHNYDLVVIGGGPAGYVAAIRAAQLGKTVACVERDRLGGVCNNWGCIPTKALLAAAEFYHRLQHETGDWGIAVDHIRHDWSKVIARSRAVADTGAQGVAFLLKKNKITHLQGHATILSPTTVRVTAADGSELARCDTRHILVATGAVPRALPGADFDGERILAARQAMSLKEQPKSLLIVGSGAIGMEFACFFNAFGTKVTVVEMLDRVLPVEDDDVSKEVAKAFTKQGVTIHTSHVITAIEKTAAGVRATLAPVHDKSKTQTVTADKVLVAIGVKGNYEGLFDKAVKIDTFKDHLQVDYKKPGATYQTSLPGVYAVGDVIGPPWLAHVASEEAIVAVERLFAPGHATADIDYHAIPGCTYCHPQVASIGLTERAVKERADGEYTVGKFPFAASGKARALGRTTGFVKLIAGKKYGEILGCHMVGEHVTELITELGLAQRLEATIDDVIATIHAHPTLGEAIHEAALGTAGRMIHY